MKRVMFFISILGFNTPLFATGSTLAEVGYREEISLGDDQTLVIAKNTDSTASVELLSGGKTFLNYSFTVGNAGFMTNSVKQLTLDKKSKRPAYLVTLYDMSSTYGAVTGVIVYENPWWGIAIVPDDKFEVKDVDGDGFYEIIGQRKHKNIFQFEAGTFKEK